MIPSTPPVPAEVNSSKPGGIVIVGRDPGSQELEYRHDTFTDINYSNGRPFVGPAGQIMDQCASAGGFRRQDFSIITNVVPWQPYSNDFKRHSLEAVEEGLKRLSKLLKRARPTLIITLGNEAAYAVLGPDVWPTAGRGIYGAKGIEDRRGYFWHSDEYDCWVLTAGHPAAALRKAVPGYYLLETDFRRARRWLDGQLPREKLPTPKRLDMRIAQKLMKHELLSCDIETKWGGNVVEMVGFAGDDYQPYIAWTQQTMKGASRFLLTSPAWKVFHNGAFDYFLLNESGVTVKNFIHDTMDMWRSLATELAGRDESGGEDNTRKSTRMTRKGLGFLPTILEYNVAVNIPWWKTYPDPKTDPDYLEKMIQLNAVDAWWTRMLSDSLLAAIIEQDVWQQYWEKRDLQAVCYDMQYRGLHVNEPLRAEREKLLVQREVEKKASSASAALAFIERYDVKDFEVWTRCPCCGGGSQAKDHCWQCGGLKKKPEKKEDYTPLMDARNKQQKRKQLKEYKVGELKEMLPQCKTCEGIGKLMHYSFNPFSGPQMVKLLYGPVGAPSSYFRGSPVMDENAIRKVLIWAKAGGKKWEK